VDRPHAAGARQLSGLGDAVGLEDLLGRCRFPPPGTAVTCGVSGGPDSTALAALAVAAGCQVTAVHVDHALRPGSAAEGEVVRATAARLGAAFRSCTVVVAPGPNVEARARRARRAALGADALLGHTADDQAETMLLHLLRGAGLDGLAGIRPDDRHPLLDLRRAETHALCDQLALEVVRDPSNDDLTLRRNRVRHEVLPLLCSVAERDVVPLFARLAGHAREAIDHLDGEAVSIDPTDAAGLASAPPVLARLAVRAWLRPCSDEAHPPDAASVDRVLAVARRDQVATEVTGGWRVARSQGRLRLEPPVGSGRGASSVSTT
jgi:tRNA(Ile)-lysidine synthase